MDIGLACSFTVRRGALLGDELDRAARAAEASGIASWWAEGDREAAAAQAHDPTLGLFAVARSSSRIRVGFSGDVVAVRSAAVRSKQIASIDWFSNGRLSLGLDLDAPPEALVDPFSAAADPIECAIQRVAAMHALWTQSRARYDGSLVAFSGAIALPKPQDDRVPTTLLRATSADVLRRYVDACGVPDGQISWLADADRCAADAARLTDVLGDDASQVRRTWVVPAEGLAAAHEAVHDLDLGVDELVAWLDHVPDDAAIADIAAVAA